MIRATVRATVREEGVRVREGLASRTGKPYRMQVVQVLDEDLNKVELSLPDDMPLDQAALLLAGAEVDIMCDISGRGQFESARIVRVAKRATVKPAAA